MADDTQNITIALTATDSGALAVIEDDPLRPGPIDDYRFYYEFSGG
ncbi:MAG: hypothetical protein WCD38_01365 [Candidatus Tumulicola sp.]